MRQNPEDFFDKMLEEEAAAPEDLNNNFAAKMADLESNISKRIDEVEKSLINKLHEEAGKPNLLDPLKNTEQDPDYNDDEKEIEEDGKEE